MDRYNRLRMPPQEALKKIEVGKLKGKSDINPQWKIEAMTEVFGLCGVGWRFAVQETETVPLDSGEVLLFMKVALQTKEGEEWGSPVYGYGGDFIVQKNKNGLVPNDEAYKMCLTDALGNAMKCVGVAADVFRGIYDTKYAKQQQQAQQQAQQAQNEDAEKRAVLLKDIVAIAKQTDYMEKMPTLIKAKFGKNSTKELTIGEMQALLSHMKTEVA